MLAIRPPEYFPRLAYFALARHTDRFVVADTFQYSRQSYQNRTRILSPDGPMWLTVPLAGGQHGTPIQAVDLDMDGRWPQVHLKALQFNYGKAPFYAHYIAYVETLLLAPPATLGELTVQSVALLARLLGLDASFVLASALPGAPSGLVEVHRHFGEPPLVALYDTAAHDNAATLGWHERPRHQPFGNSFVPDCSALDALMMYGPHARDFLA